jgi:hypothetical protein
LNLPEYPGREVRAMQSPLLHVLHQERTSKI